MTATHPEHQPIAQVAQVAHVAPTVRRRLGWLIAAFITAWMTATIMAVVAVAIGIALPRDVALITVVCTGALAALLSGHFWRIGHIDEPLVFGLLVCWSMTLGLLSL